MDQFHIFQHLFQGEPVFFKKPFYSPDQCKNQKEQRREQMKTIWGQDFDQDLLIRGAELMKDKDSGTQKQENDEQTGDDPKQGQAGS